MAGKAHELHTGSIHRAICVLLLELLLLDGCRSEERVLVSIENWPSAVEALKILPSIGGKAGRTLTVPRPEQGFVIELPPGTQGNLWLDAQGLDGNKCLLDVRGWAKSTVDENTHFPVEFGLPLFDSRPSNPQWISIWVNSSTDAWAVGAGGAVRHSNGSAWSAFSSCTQQALRDVWGSGPNDVWAVGDHGTVVHWNGFAWSAVASGTENGLLGVWGSGPNDVWAVGFDFLHWDGTAWSVVAPPPRSQLYDVWGSGPKDVWAVGAAGNVQHWNGIAWSAVNSGTAYSLSTVWGSGPSEVWVGGAAGTLLHWNGIDWSAVASGTNIWFTSLCGSGPSDVWAFGDHVTKLHWDGNTWSINSSLEAFVICGPSDVWAVGSSGAVWHVSPPR